MESYNFGPELMTLEQFVEAVGQPKRNVVIDVFELNKLEPDQARKVRKDHKLDEERPEDIYQVTKHVKTTRWQAPRSIPGLLFELGSDLARPYVVTFGYAIGVVACVPRVVEDTQEVPVIGHIHWSEAPLRQIGMWGATAKSMWRVGKPSDTGPPKQKETIDFSVYTDRARKAMGLARSAAFDYKSSHINSGLLLVGLIREGSGVAANVLKVTLDIKDREELKTTVEETYRKLTQSRGAVAIGSKIPFSFRGLEALQLAELEAKALGHDYIGTEHLLLGVAKQTAGIAEQMLMNLDLSQRHIRLEVFNLLGLKDPTA